MVEGARLESEYTAKPYRGFESLPLRQLVCSDQCNRENGHGISAVPRVSVRLRYGGDDRRPTLPAILHRNSLGVTPVVPFPIVLVK